PIELINNAIERIPDNYEKGSSILTAFFREINKLNNEYISISEAVISIFKSNYALEYDSDKIKILKGRKNQNINVLDDYDFKVIGGLYYNFKLDIVKDKVSFIDPEYFISYNYEYSKIININDRPAYEILFDQKENIQDLLYQGKLYIDVETYAIVGTEFQFSPKAIDNASSLLIKKKPPSAKIEPFYSYYKTDYIFKNGKWYLNNVKSEVHLHVLNRKTNNYSQFSTTSEFIITDRYTKDIKKFKRKDISKSTDVFVDQISKEYDEEFWGKYNIIQPDKSLIEAYKELNKNKYFFIVNKELSDE
ncbi:MAG: hypothetical protein JXB17_09525, partial [Bacteroidales bacterium]|nr:hypothetical protein [Bacteroidales bacterium]